MSTTTKMHLITLNNGAVHHLATLLSRSDLINDAGDLTRACLLQERHFLELPIPLEFPENTDQVTAVKLVRAWQREGAFPIELSERQRDTCKKIIGESIKKGCGASPAVFCLLKQFGLASEES